MQIPEMRAAQYAAHRGVSREAVRKAIASGRIPKTAIRRDGPISWINVAAADFALGQAQARADFSGDDPPAENLPPISSSPSVPEGTSEASPSLTEARTRTEGYNAEIKRLEFEQRIGRLLETDDVGIAMQRWAEVAVREIDQLASRADDLAAAFTRNGVDGVRRALKDIARQIRGTIEQNMKLLGADDVAAAEADDDATPPQDQDAST